MRILLNNDLAKHLSIRRKPIMATNVPTNTPLQQQIDEFNAQAASKIPPELRKDLQSPIGQLVTSGAVEKALKEGEQAPDFKLPDALGNQVTLSELLKRGPVVITFYRGEWCPYCNLALRAYEKALPQMQALEASLVAISPQTPDHSLSTIEKMELTFAVLSDVGNKIAREFGLVFSIDEAVRGAHRHVGANLPAYNGDESWELPMAGTFVIDQSGIVRLAFVDADFTRRLDPSAIIAKLEEMKG
jgi:peroxiredoxin